MTTFWVKRVQHVSVTRPYGSHDQVRAFYGDILGLTEITVPTTLRQQELIWYQAGDDELHLVAEDNADNTKSGRHLCLEVDDLAALRVRLGSSGVEIQEATPIPGRPRLFVLDPFGNGIELTEFELGAAAS